MIVSLMQLQKRQHIEASLFSFKLPSFETMIILNWLWHVSTPCSSPSCYFRKCLLEN